LKARAVFRPALQFPSTPSSRPSLVRLWCPKRPPGHLLRRLQMGKAASCRAQAIVLLRMAQLPRALGSRGSPACLRQFHLVRDLRLDPPASRLAKVVLLMLQFPQTPSSQGSPVCPRQIRVPWFHRIHRHPTRRLGRSHGQDYLVRHLRDYLVRRLRTDAAANRLAETFLLPTLQFPRTPSSQHSPIYPCQAWIP